MGALLIACGDTVRPVLAENTAIHVEVLEHMNMHAKRYGWSGSTIDDYRITDDRFTIQIIPGEKPASLDDLRAFRASQKEKKQ